MEKEFILPSDITNIKLTGDIHVFGIADHDNLVYNDIIDCSDLRIYIRFKPKKYGEYTASIKGYNTKKEEILICDCKGFYNKPTRGLKRFDFLISLFLGIMSIYLYLNQSQDSMLVKPFDIVINEKDTVFIGSTEEYCDPDILRYRLNANINCDRYSNKSLPELYILLNDRKIDFIVSPFDEIDTLNMVWSDSYAIDDRGLNGLRLGAPKTQNNTSLIRLFNK